MRAKLITITMATMVCSLLINLPILLFGSNDSLSYNQKAFSLRNSESLPLAFTENQGQWNKEVLLGAGIGSVAAQNIAVWGYQ